MRNWVVAGVVVCVLALRPVLTGACMIYAPPPVFWVETVEALTAESEVIFTAEVVSTEKLEGRLNIKMKNAQMLRAPVGGCAIQEEFTRYQVDDWLTPGNRVICFGYCYPPQVWLREMVSLENGRILRNGDRLQVRNMEMRPLESGEEILQVVKDEIARGSVAKGVKFLQHEYLIGGMVMADDRLLPCARKWMRSADPVARCLAAKAFEEYPDPADDAALYELLKDPFVMDSPYNASPWSGHEYLVRQTAAKALTKRGQTVPTTTLALPRNDLYQRFPTAATLAAMLLPPVGLVVVLELRRRRRGKPAYRLWRYGRAFLVCLLLWLCMWVWAAWVRSERTADNVVWSGGGWMVDAYSAHEYVFLEWAREWPEPSPVMFASVHPEKDADDRQGLSGISFRNVLNRGYTVHDAFYTTTLPMSWYCAANFSHGVDGHPFSERIGGRGNYPGGAMMIYYGWILVGLVSISAGMVLVPWAWGVARSQRLRRAIKRELCIGCGYDLRAHEVGQRCPECGRVKSGQWGKGA